MSGRAPTLPVHLSLILALVGLPLASAWASSNNAHPRHNPNGGFQSWMGTPADVPANPNPLSPDDWLGGSGNWSNPAQWSAGEPGSSSDVYINTVSDSVTLDTNATINSLTLGGTSGNSTLSDPTGRGFVIEITGALTVNQTGTLTLTQDVIQAGANSINAGTINLANASALGFSSNFTNTGMISLNGGFERPGIGVTGALTNSGNIIDDAETAALNVGGMLTNSGGIFIYDLSSGSTLTNNAGGSVGAQFINVNGDMINAGEVFGYERGSQFTIAGTLTNSGRFDTSYATANVGALNNGGEVVVGGVMTVHGNAYNSGGIWEAYIGPSNGQAFTVNGTLTNAPTGNIQLTGPYIGGVTANSIVNQGMIDLEDAPLSTGSLTNSGTLETGVHSAGNTISVTGTLSNNAGGVLSLGGSSDVANAAYVNNAGSITIASGATLNITGGSHAIANAFPGFLNSGTVLISQGGTLASPLTYTQTSGTTTVDGTLRVAGHGTVNFSGGSVYGNDGTIQASTISNAAFNLGDAPMTVGTMAINGNYTQGANGSIIFDIASQTSYDQLNVSGHAQLGGLMTVDLLNNYVPQLGNMFDIMNFASKSGTFSMVLGLPINNQEHFVLEYNPTNLTLDVVAGPDNLPMSAEANGNSYYYEPYVSDAMQGANPADFSGPPSDTVPEPGSLALLASGIVGVLGLRRKLFF